MIHNKTKPNIVFFGTPTMAVIILEEMEKADLSPSIIITTPDKPQGRKMILTPPPVKEWAIKNNIEVFQPEKLDEKVVSRLQAVDYKLFIVVAYGKIIPQKILDIPKYGTLNVHPSLLPLYRGSSPIQYQILDGAENVGVTIMLLDEQIDHGGIVAQEIIPMPSPLPNGNDLETILALIGGTLLVQTIPQWVSGKIEVQEQNHDNATFTKRIKKEDGLLNLNDDPLQNYRKIKAFHPWPGAYYFVEIDSKNIRVKIIDAIVSDGKLTITRVIPEGKKEMDYNDFLKGIHNKK